MRINDEHRQAAKQEHAAQIWKNKKDAAALGRLKAAAERKAANNEANNILIAEFKRQVAASPDDIVEIIMDWMYRISTEVTDIRKRALKAANFIIKADLKLETIHDIMFFGEMLREEVPMSVAEIADKYSLDGALKVGRTGAIAGPELRRCALKSKCLRARNRQAAIIAGKGKYCSKMCSAAAQATVRRAKRRSDQSQFIGTASQTRMNTGVERGLEAEQRTVVPQAMA